MKSISTFPALGSVFDPGSVLKPKTDLPSSLTIVQWYQCYPCLSAYRDNSIAGGIVKSCLYKITQLDDGIDCFVEKKLDPRH